VVTEFALATVITAALGSMLFLFYQGFVRGNLYGGTTGADINVKELHLSGADRSLGLEMVVSSPFP
jgi:hypothetical protein